MVVGLARTILPEIAALPHLPEWTGLPHLPERTACRACQSAGPAAPAESQAATETHKKGWDVPIETSHAHLKWCRRLLN